ncbi:trypsin-like peptidase domain-containing protein [Alkalimonas mucilaginosa]|uniref:Trypsin-like peptidase domain-containing protein n=1 Tax=Alkalimonas mucilaginosa TaxID=3057676 RepID=A0ABU7JE55_9GAMM|nr:trypsin-like peptidase domain-containing protein [Alkalimonas sp. MEB004]MEE2023902.1 trypsin-like peptidase domain-containing protein [Alkalimonas sp. MEB004]
MSVLKILFFLLRSIAYGLALALILLLLFPGQLRLAGPAHTTADAVQKAAPVSYARAVRQAAPSVVNVYTRTTISHPRSLRARTIERQELGSGVIMSPEGYILTNHHVVYGADHIEVALQDGRWLEALLIGHDEITDLALLYVETDNLPAIPQDPELQPQVGDVVLAIGNPLNLGQTVTQGIISANGNNGLSSRGYIDFMRMDAAINAGNSGGALVNSNGTLVGINAGTFQRQSQDVQGIFFAVPYQLAYRVMEKLIQHGRVIRGHLGVNGEPVINAAGDRLISSGQPLYGVQLTSIAPHSPAAEAGLQVNDILLEIDGMPLRSTQHALNVIAETPPDTLVDLTISRNNERMVIPTMIREFR